VSQETAGFIDTIRVGEADVTAVNQGRLYHAPEYDVPEEAWRAAMPEADEGGKIPADLIAFVIRQGDTVIAVDPGVNDPASPDTQESMRDWPGMTLTPGLDVALSELGIRPEDVTRVLITHAHFDHIVGLTRFEGGRRVLRFPNARVSMNAGDWEERHTGGAWDHLYAPVSAVEEQGLLDLVRGNATILPGIDMLHTPGESPGHSIIRLSSGGKRLYITGDLFHHAAEIHHLDWVPSHRPPEIMIESKRSFIDEMASPEAVVVFTHEYFPPWGKIVPENGSYRWERLKPER
jgi:glyoxylase-like metal-dependent hydrolase (beta-lactamase superfamily II)